MKLPCMLMLAMSLFVPGIAGCQWAPIGSGQHEVSPNGQYDATATFWYDGRREWLVLDVTEIRSGKVVWTANLGNRNSSHPPFDQGIGYLDLIQWAEDSSEVRFAHRSAEVTEVTEWLIVAIRDQGDAISTETVPGSRFRSVDPSRMSRTAATENRASIDQPQSPPSADQPDG